MDIGKLNRRVTIKEFVNLKDEYGGESGSWQNVKTVWTKIEESLSGEVYENDQQKAVVSIKIVLRYLSWLTEKHRLSNGNHLYEINSIVNVNNGNYMNIVDCKEIKDGLV